MIIIQHFPRLRSPNPPARIIKWDKERQGKFINFMELNNCQLDGLGLCWLLISSSKTSRMILYPVILYLVILYLVILYLVIFLGCTQRNPTVSWWRPARGDTWCAWPGRWWSCTCTRARRHQGPGAPSGRSVRTACPAWVVYISCILYKCVYNMYIIHVCIYYVYYIRVYKCIYICMLHIFQTYITRLDSIHRFRLYNISWNCFLVLEI